MQKRTLLGVYAHPDDEAFGTGGTLAKYAATGVHVALVCATRGEVGEIADPSLATPETLGDVRENELRCAAQMLGVADVVFLGYRDSGMAGTPENASPRAFVNVPADEVVATLVGIIRTLKPQVVLTFEPGGGYGHPDHIAVHRRTVAAFHAAGDRAAYPDQGAPWQPGRLLYSVIPRSFFANLAQNMAALGLDTSTIPRFGDGPLGWPDEQIDLTVDVTATVEAKWKALSCHQTQFGPNNLFRRVPEEVAAQFLSREHFALAWPQRAAGSRLPDLFAEL